MERFRTTRWSLVLQARGGDDEAGRALGELCRIYHPPVLSYVRGRGYPAAEAEDLAQGFFEQLLRLRTDARAERERGKFRVYLLVALKNFLANQAAAAQAAKRGGGAHDLSLELAGETGFEPAGSAIDRPDAQFERDFARATVNGALHRLREEAVAAGRLELFEALRPFLLESPERDEYALLSERLGLRRNTLAVAIHRLRQRLHELVRELLADTVEDSAELEGEVERLRASLGAATRDA